MKIPKILVSLCKTEKDTERAINKDGKLFAEMNKEEKEKILKEAKEAETLLPR